MLIHIFNFCLQRPADANTKQGRSIVLLFLSGHIFRPVSMLVRELWHMFHVLWQSRAKCWLILPRQPELAALRLHQTPGGKPGLGVWPGAFLIPKPPFQPAPCSERKPSTGAAPALQPDALSIPIFINLYFWGGSCPVGREKMSRSYFLAHGCLWRYLFVGMGGVWGYFPICFLLRLYQGAVLRAWAE